MAHTSNFKCWLLATVATLLLVGCTSSVVLGKVYDGFASQSAKRFNSYATFDARQKEQIDQLTASYHSWHRRVQMPGYARLLRQVVAGIDQGEKLDFATAEQWWSSARAFSDEMRQCNPLNVSADLLAGLSDKQVKQVAAKLRAQLDEREKKYLAETTAERNDRRVAEIRKWGKRAGASFNEDQQDLLRKTLADQFSLGSQRYKLRRAWQEQFIELLAERDQENFRSRIVQHIDSMWQLTSSAFPDQWASNEQLWINFLSGYLNLQTTGQRQTLKDKALKTALTLEKLSKKPVSEDAVCHEVDIG